MRQACDSDRPQMEEIFWATSARQSFSTPQERSQFLERYLGPYALDWSWVAEEQGKVLGYLVASRNTLKTAPYWGAHLELFADLLQRYPAHLHINLSSEARGKGIGAGLVEQLLARLRQQEVAGVHIITTATARNTSFYTKCGFSHRVERLLGETPLVLMGRSLRPQRV